MREDVLTALSTVRDPELDEPITTLGFVASCTVSADGQARVRLRLPTYFCAPNFAFLMVADAYDALVAIPGVRTAEVVLEDHFASDAINAGVAAQAGFVASFDGEAVAELGDLRAQFLRKAVLAGTDLVCRPLIAAGVTPAELVALTLGAAPQSAELDRLRQRRADLGLPADDSAPLLIDPETGAPVALGRFRCICGGRGLPRPASTPMPRCAPGCFGTDTPLANADPRSGGLSESRTTAQISQHACR